MTHAIAVAAALALAAPAPATQGNQGAQGARGSGQASPSPGASAAGKSPAGPAPSAAKPSPAAERVARDLTTQPNWNQTMKEYASSLSSQISAAVKSQGGEAPANVEQRVRTGLDQAVGYDEVVRLQAQALSGRFSEDELRAIAKFYESPAGKKLVTELPAVSHQVIDTVQERISAAIPHIVQDVAPSLARAHAGAGAGSEGTAPGAAPKESPKAQGRTPPAPATPSRP